MNSTAPLLRRRALLAAATGLSLQALTSLAQTGWPQRPVKLIVPNAPSSSVDTIARILGNPGSPERRIGIIQSGGRIDAVTGERSALTAESLGNSKRHA